MKKSNFGKKLLLKQETVRNLSQEELAAAEGGTQLYNNTIYGQSVGGSIVGPTKDTGGAIMNYQFFAYY